MLLGVPFVDDEHRRFARFFGVAGDCCVLRGDAFRRVDHHQRNLRSLDRFSRRDHRELFRFVGRFSLAANSGGVDDDIALAAARDLSVDRIARRAADRRDDRALFVREPVEQR